MTGRIVGWLVLLPLAAVLVVFALANRQWVAVNFDPLSSGTPLIPALDLPLFVVIYAMLIIGIVMGGTAVWLTQGRNRREKRRLRRQTETLERELAALRRAPRQKGLMPTDELMDIE